MLVYERSFEVAAPCQRVADFHRRAASLKAITPPLLPMRFLEEPPAELAPGDEVAFRTWVGPVPVRWRAVIEALEGELDGAGGEPAEGFQDRMLEGPFDHWLHRHRFTSLDARAGGGTRVHDRIEARLRRHLFWGPVGLKMWLGLPLLFAYRRAATRRLLEVGEAG